MKCSFLIRFIEKQIKRQTLKMASNTKIGNRIVSFLLY
jgi:hypothetical protein